MRAFRLAASLLPALLAILPIQQPLRAQPARTDTLRLAPVRLDSVFFLGIHLDPEILSVHLTGPGRPRALAFRACPPASPSPPPTSPAARPDSLSHPPLPAYRFEPSSGRLRLLACPPGAIADPLPSDTLLVVLRSTGRVPSVYRLHTPISILDSNGDAADPTGSLPAADPAIPGLVHPDSLPPLIDPSRPPAPQPANSPYSLNSPSGGLSASPRLDQSGSITRGIAIGNLQDPTLTSALDLRLSGALTDNLQVEATLTDQNLPFQPDGATQTLNELDRVHIRLSGGAASIELGDVDLRFTGSRFTSLERRVQGMAAEWSGGRIPAKAGLSIQRGRFRAQEIQPMDGVRGPYRLSGAFGESFITVTAGTERVWLNGRRLVRGADADYVIDYGMAEITLLGDRVLSSTDQIRVEFQYLNGEYTRTLFATGGGVEGLAAGRLDLRAFYIREADANEANRTPLLQGLGDVPPGTLVPSADSVGLDPGLDLPLYTRIDTLLDGRPAVIYRHLPGRSGNVWRVRFTAVGASAGSYVRDLSSVNGLVYRWVGQGNGPYAPMVRLQAPESRQVLSTMADVRIGKGWIGRVEWAVSDVDLNRFSTLDDADNLGQALFAQLAATPRTLGSWTLRAGASTRLLDATFESPDPVREREFSRIWGLADPVSAQPASTPGASAVRLQREWLGTGQVRLTHADSSAIELFAETLSRGRDRGVRIRTDARRDPSLAGISGFLTGDVSRLDAPERALTYRRDWVEGSVGWPVRLGGASAPFLHGPDLAASQVSRSQARGTLRPTLDWRVERIGESHALSSTSATSSTTPSRVPRDSLSPGSYLQRELTPTLRLALPSLEVSGSWGLRATDRAADGALARESRARLYRVGLQWTPEAGGFRTENRFTVLTREVSDRFATTLQVPSRTLRANSLSQYGASGAAVEGRLSWSAANELTPVHQEVYLFTGPEIGTHVWEDLNGDGVPTLDEFFPEIVEGEGVYALQLVPSDQVRPVTDLDVRWSQTLRTSPDRASLPGRPPAHSAWEWRSDIRLVETSWTDDPTSLYLLRPSAFQNPETTLSGRLNLTQHLIWTPRRPGTRLSILGRHDSGLHTRGTGWERLLSSQLRLQGEWRTASGTRLEHTLHAARNQARSPGLLNRTYAIDHLSVESAARHTWNRSWQSELRARGDWKIDRQSDPSSEARTASLALDNRLSLLGRIRSLASVEWRHTRLGGTPPLGASAWELTSGTGPGTAWVVAVQASGELSRGVRLHLRGTGRTSLRGVFRQTLEVSVSARF